MKTIPLSPELREAIVSALACIESAAADSLEARGAADREIARLESLGCETAGRIAGLKRDSVNSEDAAGKLLLCERRVTEIQAQIQRLKTARDSAKSADFSAVFTVLNAVLDTWREKVRDAVLQAMAPFGWPEHLLLPMAAHASAFRVLTVIRDSIIYSLDPPEITASRAAVYLRRALAGQLNLAVSDADDAPVSGAATAIVPADVKYVEAATSAASGEEPSAQSVPA